MAERESRPNHSITALTESVSKVAACVLRPKNMLPVFVHSRAAGS